MTEPLLLDRFVPTWDHEISVSRVFRAPPGEVFDAITTLDLFRLPVARVLLEARGLPGRLADAAARRHGEAVVKEPPTFRVRDLSARGWILLGERPGTELVYGMVGRPWKGTGGAPPEPPVTAETFAAFAEPGFAKIAESTVVTPYGVGGCVLTLESRVVTTDEDSRRRFGRYWRAAGPFIRLMRPTAMRALERQVHRGAPADEQL
ncbi:hypothetical protein SAMN05660748_0102 [Blastococcus aggregatus]|uniref:Uncharacterized protein n=1 Tax=Blastococcus aggregatus TaxID=38502 RepID=A0A285UWN7_9ACTN|nr:hypothetical protein [Blastococcus aggregatus]SOC46203.1 hypothetical protein SAMN05660748_0102 [Blastococcus aggregatus]